MSDRTKLGIVCSADMTRRPGRHAWHAWQERQVMKALFELLDQFLAECAVEEQTT